MSLLRRHRDLRLLWIGETTSRTGTSVTTVVVPLIAVTVLHSSAFTTSALTAAAWLPWLVLGLVAGPVVDRHGKRRLMVICDAVSAVLFASVPAAAALGLLTAGQLLVAALSAGCMSVLFTTGARCSPSSAGSGSASASWPGTSSAAASPRSTRQPDCSPAVTPRSTCSTSA